MTKLDLVLARIRKLPPERREALAAEIDFRLDSEEGGSVFTDEEWALIAPTLDEDQEEIAHEQVVAEFASKPARSRSSGAVAPSRTCFNCTTTSSLKARPARIA